MPGHLRVKMRGILNNKRGLVFRNAFYAIVIVGMLIYAAGGIITEWSGDYDSGIVYDLNDLDKSGEMSNIVQDNQGSITPQSSESGTDAESSTFKAVFGIITNIFKPFRLVFGDGGMIDSIGERFNIENYYLSIIVTMMGAAVIFAIIAVIFRIPGGKT